MNAKLGNSFRSSLFYGHYFFSESLCNVVFRKLRNVVELMSNKVFYSVDVSSADEISFEGVSKKDKVLLMSRFNDSFLSRIKETLDWLSLTALLVAALLALCSFVTHSGMVLGFVAGSFAVLGFLGLLLSAIESEQSKSINRTMMRIIIPFNKFRGRAISYFNNDSSNCYHLTFEEEKLLFDVAQYYPCAILDRIDELRYRRKNIPLYAQNRGELISKIDEDLRKLTAVRDSELNVALLNEIVGLFDVFLANRRSDAVAPVLPALSDLPAVMRKKEELAHSANNVVTGPVNNVSVVGCSMCNAHKEAAPR